jgi:hypothetical protein
LQTSFQALEIYFDSQHRFASCHSRTEPSASRGARIVQDHDPAASASIYDRKLTRWHELHRQAGRYRLRAPPLQAVQSRMPQVVHALGGAGGRVDVFFNTPALSLCLGEHLL